jgi:hypothetical protein
MNFKAKFTLLAVVFLSAATAFAPGFVKHTAMKLEMGYVPDGLTEDQYRKIKMDDAKKAKGKELGRLGPKGFKSRSLQSWQEAFDHGKAGHTFAPIDYKERVKRGLMKKEDVPYMVRGGNWDNSDVKGAKKLQWSKKDKDYAKGGYKKEQSASILGSGPGFDWTGMGDKKNKRNMPGMG